MLQMSVKAMDAKLEALCNVLVEAERAGGSVLHELSASVESPRIRALLAKMAHDEGYWAGALAAHLRRRGCTPSSAMGDFASKVDAVPDFGGKLDLLNRGQRWVIRRIEEHLPAAGDEELGGLLEVMAEGHRQNVTLVEAILAASRT
jgi:hypothetical protein